MDLLTEIKEDLRADRASDLWSRYGKWIIYTAVSIVIATAIAVYYKHHSRETAMKNTQVYFDANRLFASGNGVQALAALEQVSASKGSEIYSMVLLKKIEIWQSLGKNKEAEDAIHELAEKNNVYGDVGRVLSGKEAALSDAKLPVLNYSLQEHRAWALLAAGKKEEAAKQFKNIADHDDAPETLRDRARMVSHYLAGSQ